MGYRANIRTKSIIEYGSGWFNHYKSELNKFLTEECPSFYDGSDEYSDYPGESWEVWRNDVENMVENLKANCNPEEEIMGDYTAKELINIFESWLEETSNNDNFSHPNYIYIDWF